MKRDKIQWKMLEYQHRDRSVDWFWAVGIITVAITLIAIIYNNILFAIFIILGTFTLLLYAARAPRMVNFEISRRGIHINDTLYPFNTLESFWLHYHNDRDKKLIVKSEKKLMPYITLPVPDEDVEDIHLFLMEYLPEEEHNESIAEAIMEYLGF